MGILCSLSRILTFNLSFSFPSVQNETKRGNGVRHCQKHGDTFKLIKFYKE